MAGNSEKTAKRGRGKPFEKGQSENPSGRKKIPEEVKKMLGEATPEAIKLLVGIINDEEVKPELRVNCANTIIDRVLGKVAQPLEHSGKIDDNSIKVNIKVVE